MRGRGIVPTVQRAHRGITPAYAGKRAVDTVKSSEVWDHPRVCGEEYVDALRFVRRLGITPAYAGKSTRWLSNIESIRDHPRVCGEEQMIFG